MEQFLNTGVKAVIEQHPEVGAILERAGIGCVTCGAGTCLLKDVVQVHGLSKSREAALMAQIEKALYPEREVALPVISEEPAVGEAAPIRYSPPLKKLVEEHDRIKRLLAFIPAICDGLAASGSEINPEPISQCVYFIRNYADKFHHAKEEDILFKTADEDQDIIRVMIRDHQNGRGLVGRVVEGLASNNRQLIVNGLTEYRRLLLQHIKKEDEILYPWFDRNLTTRQVGELMSRFNEISREFGKDLTADFDQFLSQLDEQLNLKEELS